MNPVYTIMESPHRWSILAGIAFTAGTVGAIVLLAYLWPHWLIRIWLVAGIGITVYCLVRGALDWKQQAERELKRAESGGSRQIRGADGESTS